MSELPTPPTGSTIGLVFGSVSAVVIAWIQTRGRSEPSDEQLAEAGQAVAAHDDTAIAAPLARVLAAQSERLEELSSEIDCLRGKLAATDAVTEQLRADRDEDRDALRSLIDAWRTHLPEVPLPIRPPQWYADHPHYRATATRGLEEGQKP